MVWPMHATIAKMQHNDDVYLRLFGIHAHVLVALHNTASVYDLNLLLDNIPHTCHAEIVRTYTQAQHYPKA